MDFAIVLDEITLSPDLGDIYNKYLEFSSRGQVKANHTRLEDFRRWEVVSKVLLPSTDHLDVGSGVGQLANLLSKSFGAGCVSACDIKKHWLIQNIYGFNYFEHDVRKYFNKKYQTITCLEALEHIEDNLEFAVENLKAHVDRQLLVSVPYCEKMPLGTGHYHRFDKTRLLGMFPGADLYFCLNGSLCQWVLADWRP